MNIPVKACTRLVGLVVLLLLLPQCKKNQPPSTLADEVSTNIVGDFIETLDGRKVRDIADLPAFITSKGNSEDKTLKVMFQRYNSQEKKFVLWKTSISF